MKSIKKMFKRKIDKLYEKSNNQSTLSSIRSSDFVFNQKTYQKQKKIKVVTQIVDESAALEMLLKNFRTENDNCVVDALNQFRDDLGEYPTTTNEVIQTRFAVLAKLNQQLERNSAELLNHMNSMCTSDTVYFGKSYNQMRQSRNRVDESEEEEEEMPELVSEDEISDSDDEIHEEPQIGPKDKESLSF